MSTALIQQAADAGIRLFLVDGKLRYKGKTDAVNAFLPTLQAHKSGIKAALEAANDPAPTSTMPDLPAMAASMALDAQIIAAGLSPPPDSPASPSASVQHKPPPKVGDAAWLKREGTHRVYMKHHFNCPTCQAAGRGSQYGKPCNTGAALWTIYESSIEGQA